jgi:hypothetical protein
VASRPKITEDERSGFVESEEWKIEIARLEAARPRCVVVLTKTFCCGRLIPVVLEGDVLERWISANYFYTSGSCPDCESDPPLSSWSLTHYDDAYIIWNGHGLNPHLDDDAETLLH